MQELGRVLKMNCTLRVLNLESNRITRKGIKALMRSLSENPDTMLRELRMANQVCGCVRVGVVGGVTKCVGP